MGRYVDEVGDRRRLIMCRTLRAASAGASTGPTKPLRITKASGPARFAKGPTIAGWMSQRAGQSPPGMVRPLS